MRQRTECKTKIECYTKCTDSSKCNDSFDVLQRSNRGFRFSKIWLYSLRIKPTDALNFNFIAITTLCVSGSLSVHHQEFLAIYRLWYILCGCDEPFATRSRMELRKMYQSRCMAKNSWWWAERLPETCRVVIPIKLEFNVSVGFIHKESVTMHGHTIVKIMDVVC